MYWLYPISSFVKYVWIILNYLRVRHKRATDRERNIVFFQISFRSVRNMQVIYSLVAFISKGRNECWQIYLNLLWMREETNFSFLDPGGKVNCGVCRGSTFSQNGMKRQNRLNTLWDMVIGNERCSYRSWGSCSCCWAWVQSCSLHSSTSLRRRIQVKIPNHLISLSH